MLDKALSRVYLKFKLNFYRKIFKRFEEREASLTAVETLCVEVIHALDAPTISEFADFVMISQANAAYKIQNLIKKGYVIKKQSTVDRREYRLHVTEKFFLYYGISQDYLLEVSRRIQNRFSEDEIKMFHDMLVVMDSELMPEIELKLD